MKYLTSVLCCLAFAISGISLALSEKDEIALNHATVSAATIPQYAFPTLPLDVQLDLNKKSEKPDTVYVTDTVPGKPIIKYRTKYIPAPDTGSTAAIPDSPSTPVEMDIGAVKKEAGVVREEQATDNIGPPEGSIILIVDGEEVYKR